MSVVSPAEKEGVAVTAVQLAAVIALARGEKDRGLILLQQAAEAEDKMPFDYGPPLPPKPSRELLGEALLEAGRATEAAEAFRAASEASTRPALVAPRTDTGRRRQPVEVQPFRPLTIWSPGQLDAV